MKKLVILLFVILTIAGCNITDGYQITKIYFVEKYKVHDIGVEVWITTETGEDVGGKFIKHENIYSCEEKTSRVISLCCQHEQIIYNEYLYFSEEEFKEYIKERYNIK